MELRNTGAAAADLSGKYLTDDRARKNKWAFPPGASIPPGGWLVVSPSEVSDALFPGFTPVNVRGARFYRKAPAASVPAPARVRAAPSGSAARPAVKNARALADSGRLADALGACATWISGQPLHPPAHYMHAMVLLELHDAAGALGALNRAVYLDADFVMAHLALGRLALAQGPAADAARHFSNARRLLQALPADFAVPEADGLDAGRLLDVLASLEQVETAR